MNVIKCGDILISKHAEFIFVCIKCHCVFKIFDIYKKHIIEEHGSEIFEKNFRKINDVEFAEPTSPKSEPLSPLSGILYLEDRKDKSTDSNYEDVYIESSDDEDKNEVIIEKENTMQHFDISEEVLEMENKTSFDGRYENDSEEESEDQLSYDELQDDCFQETLHDNIENIEFSDTVQCEHCNKSFNESNDYKKHQKRNKCGICPICEKNYSDIWSHISKFHREYYLERKNSGKAIYVRPIPLQRNLYCEYCDRTFKKERPFRDHVNVHEKSLDKCKYCGKYFKGKVQLATHVRTHTGERPFKCSNCPLAFSDNANLKTHFIIKHTEGLNVKCRFKECTKTFKTKELRNRHERYVHEEKRDYLCLSCGMSFKTSSKLNIHVKMKHVDYNDRPFKCTFCEKKYIFQRDFNQHMMVHTGEIPFQCGKCAKGFRKRYSLTRHYKRMHQKTTNSNI